VHKHGGIVLRSKLDRLTGLEEANIAQRPDIAIASRRLERFFRHIDGEPEFAVKNTHPASMIAVIMRYEQGPAFVDIPAVPCQPLFSLFAGDSGIKQQAHVVGLDVERIAIASGLQRDNLHGSPILQLDWNRHNKPGPSLATGSRSRCGILSAGFGEMSPAEVACPRDLHQDGSGSAGIESE
jgi:hypothetical protein